MTSKPYLRLSVHGLIDFLLRKGDIDNRVYNKETMKLGSILHASYQEKQGNEYLSEYPLSGEVETESGIAFLQGRADGIIIGKSFPTIDEIKSTVAPLEEFYNEQREWHLGQAMIYAYLYCKEKKIAEAGIRLTYISQLDPNKKKHHSSHFTFQELESYAKALVEEYFKWESKHIDHLEERDESIKDLKFPYPSFRNGQREFSGHVYQTAKKGGIIFAEAPTGIGKTMSSLYPSVMAFSSKTMNRIFYLTAKNTGGYSAYSALADLYEAGFKGRDSFLVAKEKICFCPGHTCNPDDCPFAKGYYTKRKEALEKALKLTNRFDLLFISEFCSKLEICPFEFQLDLSLEADVIIADYNYFFDPRAKLERFFDETVDSSLDFMLIDEAHNLVERGKAMYSASISTYELNEAIRALKGSCFATLRNNLKKMANFIKAYGEQESNLLEEPPIKLLSMIETMRKNEQKANKLEGAPKLPPEFVTVSRDCGKFKLIAEEYANASFRYYLTRGEKSSALHLDCLDASAFLSDSLSKVKGAALFSATLSPISYYTSSIVGKDDEPYLLLPSPFPKENLNLMVASNVSVRFRDRESSYPLVASYLKSFVSQKVGNYFLYFPSFAYLEKIRTFLDFPEDEVVVQTPTMTNQEKEGFLASFIPNPTKTQIGLLTLGGAFSEGVDLVDDRLIGVAIVGVGLPSVSFENDLLMDYYEKKHGDGFNYAYQYPGMNKVAQAVGRLIRTETDRGSALLIDDRYKRKDYREFLSRLWGDYSLVFSPLEVEKTLRSFYKKEAK